MDIDLKGPRALIVDVSEMTGTIDAGGEIHPLTWHYVMERELVEKVGLTIVSTVPKSPSLSKQYSTLKGLLDRYSASVVDQLHPCIFEPLRDWVVEIVMTTEYLVLIKRKQL